MKTPFFIISVLLLAVSLASALGGCVHSSRTDKELERAEQLMTERPDSSLIILRDIEPGQLVSDRERAMYGLLLTMAEDKNWLDPANDSIISFAAGYFAKTGDTDRLIKSQYYRGRVLYHKKEYSSSLISFLKSKNLSEESGDNFWAGMSCRGISDILLQTGNKADELSYARQEYENIKKSGIQPYLNYALLDLCSALNNNLKMDSVLAITEQLIDSAKVYDDKNLYFEALRLKGNATLYGLEDFKASSEIFEEICGGIYSDRQDSLRLALSYAQNGDIDKSREILSAGDLKNSLLYDYILYKINKKEGKSLLALEALERLKSAENEKLKEKVTIELSASITNYMEDEKIIKRLQIENRLKTLFVIAISGILLFIVGIVIVGLLRKNRRIRQSKLELALEFQALSKERENDIKENSSTIQKLLRKNSKTIEELSDVIRCSLTKEQQERKIVEKVNLLIKKFSDTKEIKKLEKIINESCHDIMKDLSEDFPGLPEIDKNIFLYSAMGFSTPSIELFLQLPKTKTVYNRKNRLKEKILALPEEKSSRYLSYL